MKGGANRLQAEDVNIIGEGLQLTLSDGSVDFSLALSLLVATYWVYSIQYPDEARNTLRFLDSFVYCLASTKAVPCSLAKLHNELYKHKE